jgi:hypothetical protein
MYVRSGKTSWVKEEQGSEDKEYACKGQFEVHTINIAYYGVKYLTLNACEKSSIAIIKFLEKQIRVHVSVCHCV